MRFKKLKLLSTLSMVALLFACVNDKPSSDTSSSLGSSNNSSIVESSSSVGKDSSSSSSSSKGDSSSSNSSSSKGDSSSSSSSSSSKGDSSSSVSSSNSSSSSSSSTTGNSSSSSSSSSSNSQTSSNGGTSSSGGQTSSQSSSSSTNPTIQEPALVEDKTFDTLADASSPTVDNKHLYKVEGIWFPDVENNQGGKGTLKLATSSKTISIYGLANSKNGSFTFDNTTGVYSFTNPNNYAQLGLHEGDKLVLVIGVHTEEGYAAYLQSKTAYTEIKYDINVTIEGSEGGNASLSVQDNKGYLGQEVTLTTTPSMGYEVESVKFNNNPLTVDSTPNTYKFKVAFPTNEVMVKFTKSKIEEPAVVENVGFDTLADASSPTVDNKHLYKVEGIWFPDADNNQGGKGTLKLATSSKTISIYGLANAKEGAFEFDDNNGEYSFNNPNKYSQAELHEGDKLVLVIGVHTEEGYAAYLQSKTSYTEIKYDINVTIEGSVGGKVSLSVQDSKGYLGEEITLTTTPDKYFEVANVKHNGSEITTTTLNNYKFNVAFSTNDVVVKFTAPTFGMTQEVTAVYAQVPSDWDNIHIHYWNAEDESAIEEGYGSSWPGEKMTLINEEEHLYGFKVPKGTANVIINNGGTKQTIDLKYATDKNLIVVDNEVIVSEDEATNGKYDVKYGSYTTKPTDPELAEKEYLKIEYTQMYFKVPSDWTTPSIYYFGTVAPGAPSWPGTALTKVEGKENVFTFEKLPTDVAAFIITDGASEGTKQTANLDLYVDLDYNINGYEVTLNGQGGFDAAPKTYNKDTGEFSSVTILETNYYVTGDKKGGWGFDPQYRLRHDKESNSASITISFAIDEEFKVAVNGWSHDFGYSEVLWNNDDFESAYGNIKVKKECTYKITVNNISGNSSQRTISFEKIS